MARGHRREHQNLAAALIFLLCVREVAAARDSFQAQQLAAHVGSQLKAAGAQREWRSAVAESGEFSIRTMWAIGEEDSLRWAEANITFRFSGEENGGRRQRVVTRYVEVAGLDTLYRIMPDAVVLNQQIDGMAVMAVVGWQAYDKSSHTWGSSEYAKKRAMFFRTEMNPSVGVTTSSFWGRLAGLKVYRTKAKDKSDDEVQMYYINENGKMKFIDQDDVTQRPPEHEELEFYMPGYAAGVFTRPDRELMGMVDGMLGETSCLGSPSKCAFRCFFDSERDVCGPTGFCRKVGADDVPDVLAPFGQQQKCRAVGADSHEEADMVLAGEMGLGNLKEMALNVSERLLQSEAVSWSSSGRSSLKTSVALWLEAADLLNVLETLPMRLGEESGDFRLAARRAAATDLKHWRRRPDRLTASEYRAAASAPAPALRASRRLSVAAKLHSELVSFLVKRPSVLMIYAKSESEEKCVLKDDTAEEKAQVSTFVNYFLKVPGYNADDLRSTRLGLPTHCQEFLAGAENMDVEHLAQDASEGERVLEKGTSSSKGASNSFGELRSRRLASALRLFGAGGAGGAASFGTSESRGSQEGNAGDAGDSQSAPRDSKDSVKDSVTGTALQSAVAAAKAAEGAEVEGAKGAKAEGFEGVEGSEGLAGQSLLGLGAGADLEVHQKFVIIASIIVGLVCLVVAGTFFIAGLANLNGCLKQSGAAGGEHCLAALVCSALGGLVICGAFAMSLVVGVAALAGALFLVNIARHYLLQTDQRELGEVAVRGPLMATVTAKMSRTAT